MAPYYSVLECGSKGDWGYCSIAKGLSLIKGSKQTIEKDFEPGGKLQAQLRLVAMNELLKNPKAYAGIERKDVEP